MAAVDYYRYSFPDFDVLRDENGVLNPTLDNFTIPGRHVEPFQAWLLLETPLKRGDLVSFTAGPYIDSAAEIINTERDQAWVHVIDIGIDEHSVQPISVLHGPIAGREATILGFNPALKWT